ncbi:hypothetical protein [Bradyrhizobium sp. URHD0069]|uniref:hypothetical protein n=1 Tax=Bradyrhizobium sp. URHD0069 TaxID=1380355 RepID=UPI000AEA8029
MLKKYISKFTMDILPSVAATIIGAYIVNHYIVAKPAANAPATAAISSDDLKKPDTKSDANPPETVANAPEAGVKAKGISERAILEKSAAEKPAEKPAANKPIADKPAETASVPVETRRHQAAPREKPVAKAVAAPVQPAASATAPAAAAPTTVPPVEAASPPEERRDANDLARAAIERLRGANDGSPRAQEAARIPEAPRVPDQPRVVSAPPVPAPSARPLPPPIMVSTPATENLDSSAGSSQMRPPYAGAARIDDPRRPTPPADIPAAAPSRPLDLHAEAAEPTSTREHTTVADDMLSAAKSVFHAVLPK